MTVLSPLGTTRARFLEARERSDGGDAPTLLDDDFEALRHVSAFQELTEPPPHPAAQRRAARRAR